MSTTLPIGIQAGYVGLLLPPTCEDCGSTRQVRMEDSRTMYDSGDPGRDKIENRKQSLCRECADEHHAYWDEQWREYHAGCM